MIAASELSQALIDVREPTSEVSSHQSARIISGLLDGGEGAPDGAEEIGGLRKAVGEGEARR